MRYSQIQLESFHEKLIFSVYIPEQLFRVQVDTCTNIKHYRVFKYYNTQAVINIYEFIFKYQYKWIQIIYIVL